MGFSKNDNFVYKVYTHVHDWKLTLFEIYKLIAWQAKKSTNISIALKDVLVMKGRKFDILIKKMMKFYYQDI